MSIERKSLGTTVLLIRSTRTYSLLELPRILRLERTLHCTSREHVKRWPSALFRPLVSCEATARLLSGCRSSIDQ